VNLLRCSKHPTDMFLVAMLKGSVRFRAVITFD